MLRPGLEQLRHTVATSDRVQDRRRGEAAPRSPIPVLIERATESQGGVALARVGIAEGLEVPEVGTGLLLRGHHG